MLIKLALVCVDTVPQKTTKKFTPSPELKPSLREMTTAPQRWRVKQPKNLGGNLNSCSTQKTLQT
jgi:hypothetical protein